DVEVRRIFLEPDVVNPDAQRRNPFSDRVFRKTDFSIQEELSRMFARKQRVVANLSLDFVARQDAHRQTGVDRIRRFPSVIRVVRDVRKLVTLTGGDRWRPIRGAGRGERCQWCEQYGKSDEATCEGSRMS